jgi:hypothetical protein
LDFKFLWKEIRLETIDEEIYKSNKDDKKEDIHDSSDSIVFHRLSSASLKNGPFKSTENKTTTTLTNLYRTLKFTSTERLWFCFTTLECSLESL